MDKSLLDIGLELCTMLTAAKRHDEISLACQLINSYSYIFSIYAEKSNSVPESLAVDLNEAALLKLSNTSDWKIFAQNFENSVLSLKHSSPIRNQNEL